MIIFFIFCLVKSNTILLNQTNDSTQEIEIILKNQYKFKSAFLMRKINEHPFFEKDITIARQRYYHTSRDGTIREVSMTRADNFNNLSTVLNLSVKLNDVPAGSDYFIFLMAKDGGMSYNIGGFDVDSSHFLKASKDISFTTRDHTIPLETVSSPLRFKTNEEDEERKKWNSREVLIVIFSTALFTTLIILLCIWYSKTVGSNRKTFMEENTQMNNKV